MKVTPSPLLTRAELADRWHMSVRTLETWCRDERGPQPQRFGRRALYLLAEVEAFEIERFEHGEYQREEPRGAARDAVASNRVGIAAIARQVEQYPDHPVRVTTHGGTRTLTEAEVA